MKDSAWSCYTAIACYVLWATCCGLREQKSAEGYPRRRGRSAVADFSRARWQDQRCRLRAASQPNRMASLNCSHRLVG
jgi:hypothetical protein